MVLSPGHEGHVTITNETSKGIFFFISTSSEEQQRARGQFTQDSTGPDRWKVLKYSGSNLGSKVSLLGPENALSNIPGRWATKAPRLHLDGMKPPPASVAGTS
ncbi:hypothetical protein HL42_2103 [Trichophyton rubrum]|nr:hypothetical protein HL42_2103 [Trichophyton rubrum]